MVTGSVRTVPDPTTGDALFYPLAEQAARWAWIVRRFDCF